MRMRISSFLKCFAIVGMATLVSCSKDDGKGVPDVVQGAFSINGQKYNTLQDAVNAAKASGSDETVITLTASTSGDGCDAKEGIFNIDFGTFEYYLNPGKTLSFEHSHVAMTGKGGSIEGDGTIIKGSKSGLSFEGNLNIDGDMDVNAMDYFGFVEDYSGVYSGNLKLNDTYMYVEADKAVLDIETLNPVNSTLNVIKAQSVNVDNVAKGSSKFPVCAAVANVVTVKDGAEVHVHAYGAGEPALCSSPELMVKSCPVCDDMVYYNDETNTTFAPCHTETLVHVEGVEATEKEWGNVEYWECGICGGYYSDKDAQKPLEPKDIMIEPKSEFKPGDYDVENTESQTRALPAPDPKTLEKVMEGVEQALELASGIADYIQGDPTPEEQLLSKFLRMDEKLDEINKKLDEMQGDLNSIGSLIKGTSAEFLLTPRVQQLDDLYSVKTYFKRVYQAAKAGGLKKEALIDVLNAWNSKSDRHMTALTLARTFGSMGSNMRSVDQLWKDVLSTDQDVIWEHDSYGARKMELQKDATIIQCSAVLSACYMAFVKDYGKTAFADSLRKDELTLLKTSLTNYETAMQTAIKSMDERGSKYMILNVNGDNKDVVFDRTMGDYDVYQALWDNRENFTLHYKTHRPACMADKFLDLIGLRKEFDEKLIQKLLKRHQTNKAVDALIKAGFKGLDRRSAVLMALHDSETYEHAQSGRNASCYNLRWCSKSKKDDDELNVRGILYDVPTLFKFHSLWNMFCLIQNCNIDEDNGKITNFGDRSWKSPFKGPKEVIIAK